MSQPKCTNIGWGSILCAFVAGCATTTSHDTFVTSPNAALASPRDGGDGTTTAPTASHQTAPDAPAFDGALDQEEPSFTFEVSTVTRGGTTQFCYDHTVGNIATGRKCFASKAVYCENLCLESNAVSQRVCRAECPPAPTATPTTTPPPEAEAPTVNALTPR